MLDHTATLDVPLKSSPLRALRSVFETPNWPTNLLWLTIAMLLNGLFIGQIGLFGYGAELLEKRAGRPGMPTLDIDSGRLGDYIGKGIWPFVVNFLIQIAFGLVIAIPIGVLVLVGIAAGSAAGGDSGAALSLIVVVPLVLLLSIGTAVFSVPFLINAMVCQDFQKSFDFGWAIGFVKIMFWEIVISAIVYYLLSLGVVLIGMLMLCLGYIPALGVVAGGAMHMLAQWYEVYLSRGGVPATPPAASVIDASIV